MNPHRLAALFRQRATIDLEIAAALEEETGEPAAMPEEAAGGPEAAPIEPARQRRRRLLKTDAQGHEDAARGLKRAGVYPRGAWQR